MNGLHRVFITGLGIVSPLGLDTDTTWSRLQKGHSGIDYITALVSCRSLRGVEVPWAFR